MAMEYGLLSNLVKMKVRTTVALGLHVLMRKEKYHMFYSMEGQSASAAGTVDFNVAMRLVKENSNPEALLAMLAQPAARTYINWQDDISGETLLSEAAGRASQNIINALVQALGMNVNMYSRDGGRPLFRAIERAYLFGEDDAIHFMELMCRHGANVNVLDAENDSPLLMSMVFCGHFQCVQWLLNQRAIDATLQNQQGQTVLEIAQMRVDALVGTGINSEFIARQMLLAIQDHMDRQALRVYQQMQI